MDDQQRSGHSPDNLRFTEEMKGYITLGEPDHRTGFREATAEVVASGILNIYLVDFMKQLTTFRVDGDHRAKALNDFGGLFLGKLWDLYKGPAVAAAGAG